MPAKRERELEGALVSQFAGLTGDAIECAIRLEIFKSDGRRADPVPQAKNRDRQLGAAGGFDQMANHAFGPTDVELIDAIMEHLADAGNFGGVVLFGPGSVGIDVADILDFEFALLQGLLDQMDQCFALNVEPGHVVRFTDHRAPIDGTVDSRISP